MDCLSSIRFLLIAACLLLAGTVEACEIKDKELFDWHCHKQNCEQKSGQADEPNVITGGGFRILGSGQIMKEPSCYQRMQEAMRTMDYRVQHPLDNVLFNSATTLIMPHHEKEQWRETMAECVK